MTPMSVGKGYTVLYGKVRVVATLMNEEANIVIRRLGGYLLMVKRIKLHFSGLIMKQRVSRSRIGQLVPQEASRLGLFYEVHRKIFA